MASDPSTVECIVDQMSRDGAARARSMVGEHGVCVGDRFVGVMSNDRLYLKITDPGRALLPDAGEGAPCDGARPHLMVPGDVIEDADRLEALARATADALPAPKPKRAKRS